MEKTENKNLCVQDSKQLAREAVKILLEKKGIDVKLYSVEGITSVTDYYVNATGRSQMHVGSLGEDVADMLSMAGRSPLRIEGRQGNSWILVDFGDVIVNVFDKASREFYDFDRLLPAEALVNIDDLVSEVDEKMKINTAKE